MEVKAKTSEDEMSAVEQLQDEIAIEESGENWQSAGKKAEDAAPEKDTSAVVEKILVTARRSNPKPAVVFRSARIAKPRANRANCVVF